MIRPPARIGVVTGSRAEARCLPREDRFLVRCSGTDPGRARADAEALVAAGVDGLLSFGLAGGLDPALRPGDLLLPEVVLPSPGAGVTVPVDGGGKGGGDPGLRTSDRWRDEVSTRLETAGMPFLSGSLVGSDTAVTTPAGKGALYRASGAVAVDMESRVVGDVAHRHGVPLLVLRAVADPADAILPAAALRALRPDGSSDLAGLLRALRARPADLLPLIRLVRDAGRGFRTLRRASRAL